MPLLPRLADPVSPESVVGFSITELSITTRYRLFGIITDFDTYNWLTVDNFILPRSDDWKCLTTTDRDYLREIIQRWINE